MGQGQLINKLSKVLDQDVTSEIQMVYILSRIRKVLELNNIKDRYSILNFFSNWALHTEIEKGAYPISPFLTKVIVNDTDDDGFGYFDLLFDDLDKFLIEFKLPKRIMNANRLPLRNILGDIFSDTPLIIQIPPDKYEVKISRPEKPSVPGAYDHPESMYYYDFSTRKI